MINGPGYLYLEIPRCGSTYVGDLLIEQCEGTRITPRHDTLTWDVPADCLVFTTVRKPYARMMSLWKYLDEDHQNSDFISWYEWAKDRETNVHVEKPYSFWTDRCNTVLKMEQLEDRLPALLKKLKFEVKLPEFRETTHKMTPEEREYIRTVRKEDFVQHGYSLDARSKI